ncbi:hypothetical protein QE152_g35714 [Popillia japonica]|uniref:Uncharacterized protein n=1 Tax=Popillia japonica TaxID=7064 RepID=A0AAW1IF74_POPJA
MAFKLFVLCAALAVANAGYLSAPAAVSYSAAPAVSHVSYASPLVSYGTPTVTSQSANILRSYGNLGQVSTYTKTIDNQLTSSVATAIWDKSQLTPKPSIPHSPASARLIVRKADVRVSNPGLRVAAAPAVAYAAPAVSYASAPALSYAAHAPAVAYSAPAYAAHAPAVAYSAAPAVAHVSFNGLGINYGW